MEFEEEHLKPGRGFKNLFLEVFPTFLIVLLIVLTIRTFIAEPHAISGSSMVPTFHHGDYIITNLISYRFTPIKRGDVVVFKDPKNESEAFIKRMIGLPGDTVLVKNGLIYLNGERLLEPYLASNINTQPNNFLKEDQPVTVPDGRYFVLGDNREQSSDSRDWGFVTRDEILGKVFLRLWPPNKIQLNPGEVSLK